MGIGLRLERNFRNGGIEGLGKGEGDSTGET